MTTPRIISSNDCQHHTPWYIEKVDHTQSTGHSFGISDTETLYQAAVNNALKNATANTDFAVVSDVTQIPGYCKVSLNLYRKSS